MFLLAPKVTGADVGTSVMLSLLEFEVPLLLRTYCLTGDWKIPFLSFDDLDTKKLLQRRLLDDRTSVALIVVVSGGLTEVDLKIFLVVGEVVLLLEEENVE